VGCFKNARTLTSYQSANHVHAFFPADELTPDLVTLPVVSIFDLAIYGLNSDLEHQGDFTTLSKLFFNISCQQHVEIYKIFVILFYTTIILNNE
jgi:hypothetical protein